MKTLLVIIFLLTATVARGAGVSVDATRLVYSDAELRGAYGIKARVRHGPVYLWGSWEEPELRFCGQSAGVIDLWGVGLGIEREIVKHISIWVDAGYYHPCYSRDGRQDATPDEETSGRNLYYKTTSMLPAAHPRMWDYYTMSFKDGVGGSAGVAIGYQARDCLTLHLLAGYRCLMLPERITGNDYGIDAGWEFENDRDFSGMTIGVNVDYAW